MDSSSSENQLIKKKGRRTYRRKLVGLYLGEHDSRFRQGVLQVALESGWDLLDIGLMGTLRPLAYHQLDGVIMDLLPTDPIVKSLIKKGIPTVRYGIVPTQKTVWNILLLCSTSHFADDSSPTILPKGTLNT